LTRMGYCTVFVFEEYAVGGMAIPRAGLVMPGGNFGKPSRNDMIINTVAMAVDIQNNAPRPFGNGRNSVATPVRQRHDSERSARIRSL
jgi:hypothetical protein